MTAQVRAGSLAARLRAAAAVAAAVRRLVVAVLLAVVGGALLGSLLGTGAGAEPPAAGARPAPDDSGRHPSIRAGPTEPRTRGIGFAAPAPQPDPPAGRGDPPPAPAGAGVPAPGADYAWPLHPAPAVLAPFHAPDHAYGPGHRGVDLAGTPGQPVLAARPGVVVFAGPVGGRGVVSVEHPDGLRTTYEPVRPTVRAGVAVGAGSVLGALLASGHRGCATACLHWGLRRDRLEYLDPLVLLRPTRVRLLPVPPP